MNVAVRNPTTHFKNRGFRGPSPRAPAPVVADRARPDPRARRRLKHTSVRAPASPSSPRSSSSSRRSSSSIVSLLIWPFRMLWRADDGRAAAARIDHPADRRRPRRTGPEADRPVHEGRPAAELQQARRERMLPAAADHVPVGVAGRVVVVQHRHASGAPQHLRFPRPRPAHVPAAAVLDPHRQGRAVPAARAATAFRCTSRSCGSSGSRSRSGRSSASTASGARCCACRSRFRRISSTAPS